MEHWVALTLVSIVDACSITACAMVLWRVKSMPMTSRRRLFPRQVAVLALSDIFYSCIRIPWSFTGFAEEGLSDGTLFMMYWSYETTLLAELCIMLGFTLQSISSNAGLKALNRFAWAPVLLAAASAGFSLLLYDGIRHTRPWATVQSVAALVALFGGVVTILVLSCQASGTTHAVTRRGWIRAIGFIVNFLVTVGPEAVMVLVCPQYYRDDVHTINKVRLLTTMCMHSNGLVNSATYLFQSRYVRHTPEEMTDLNSSVISHQVRFGGVTVEDLNTFYELSATERSSERKCEPESLVSTESSQKLSA